MRMILAVIVVLVIGVNPHWQKYKDEKIAAHQAKTGSRLIRPFEFYQKRSQYGGVEVLTGVKTHHLDFNMIEHGDSLCCLGVEQPIRTLWEPVEMGIE